MLFDVIGRAEKAAGKGWILLVDEVQYLAEADLSALIVAIHRMSQDTLPVLLVGAGLPKSPGLQTKQSSILSGFFFIRRLAHSINHPLFELLKPIVDEDASIEPAALDEIIDRTRGYPFFLQEWASATWNNAAGPEITLDDVNQSYNETLALLDAGFFRVRIDRLTRSEVLFVKTMSELGDGPYAMADIAKALGRTQSSLGPVRASIISKGMIYSTDHGYLDFTVPLFSEYMRRRR